MVMLLLRRVDGSSSFYKGPWTCKVAKSVDPTHSYFAVVYHSIISCGFYIFDPIFQMMVFLYMHMNYLSKFNIFRSKKILTSLEQILVGSQCLRFCYVLDSSSSISLKKVCIFSQTLKYTITMMKLFKFISLSGIMIVPNKMNY